MVLHPRVKCHFISPHFGEKKFHRNKESGLKNSTNLMTNAKFTQAVAYKIHTQRMLPIFVIH